MSFLKKYKYIFLATSVIVTVLIVALLVYNKNSGENKTEIQVTSGETKNLAVETEIVEVEEEIIKVAKDNLEEKEREEDKKEEVSFKGKTVQVPKSTVAAVNSVEDAERSKKTGGNKVTSEEAQNMFQNEGTHSNGIDVSAHNGVIDWKTVAANGVDFAIIRCGFRGYSEGKIYEDAYFKSNVAGATAAGVKVGIYFYSAAVTEEEALEEAAWVVKKISTYRITYPVVYDFEEFGMHRCSGVNGTLGTNMALTFLNYVKANGYEPMLYASKNDIRNNFNKSAFSCKFWLAHYTTKTDYTGSYNMWQYTSKGSVPGISGNVDMNIAYFSYGTTASPKHTHNFTEIVKETKATCIKEGSIIKRCSCGETETETLKIISHTFGEYFKDEKDGKTKRVCTVCKKEEIKEEVTNTVSNNVISNNTISNTNTNKVEENNIVLNNVVNNSTDNTNSIENNINENTNTIPTNNVPANDVTNEIVEEHTHKYTEETVKEATCKDSGIKKFNCTCGDNYTEEIPKLTVHSYENGTCSVCGEIDPNFVEPENKIEE